MDERKILVKRIISEHGVDWTYVLYEGDKVKCKRCGKLITVSNNTVGTDKDGFTFIKCDNNEILDADYYKKYGKLTCGYSCNAVHYIKEGTRIKEK